MLVHGPNRRYRPHAGFIPDTTKLDAAGISVAVERYCIAQPLLLSRKELPMKQPIDRREFLKLAGLGGVVFASSLGTARGAATMATAKAGDYDDFYFVQLSD